MLGESASQFEIRSFVLAACVVGFAVSGCGRIEPSSDANGSSSGDAGSASPSGSDVPSGGTFSGTDPFRAFVHVTAVANGAKPSDVPVVIEIQISLNEAPLSDATVMAGPQGKTTMATQVKAGDYVVEETGLAPWYEVDIATSGASLTDIRLQAPALHTVSIPSVPTAHRPALVKWDPSHDPAVNDVEVAVLSWQQHQTTYDQHVTDTGELTLPGTAMSSGDTVTVQIRRATSIALDVPNSAAIVDVTSTADTVVR